MKIRNNKGQFIKGFRHTYKSKEEMSKRLMGNKRNLGKHHSEETKRKLREPRIGRKPYIMTPQIQKKMSYVWKNKRLGQDNPNWSGGCPQYYKKIIFKRDNWVCQKCKIADKEVLVIDHIIPKSIRPDLRGELTNLMTLCANCHMKKSKIERRSGLYGMKKVEQKNKQAEKDDSYKGRELKIEK